MNARSTYFGQEFPSTFRQREREKERAAWNKNANVLRHGFSLTQFSKAGCAALSRPTAKMEVVSLQNNKNCKLTAIYVFQATQ